MGSKKKPKLKKAKQFVCVICKGDKKVQRKKNCCSKDMLSSSKGSWNL